MNYSIAWKWLHTFYSMHAKSKWNAFEMKTVFSNTNEKKNRRLRRKRDESKHLIRKNQWNILIYHSCIYVAWGQGAYWVVFMWKKKRKTTTITRTYAHMSDVYSISINMFTLHTYQWNILALEKIFIKQYREFRRIILDYLLS